MNLRVARLAVIASLALSAACRQSPEAASRTHVSRGDRYAADHKIREAIVEYKTAIQYVPRSGEAHYRLAEALVVDDNMRAAFTEYMRAADLLPDREDVQIKAGNLQLIAGRFVDAKARARALLQRNPRSAAAMILLGNALAGMRDLDGAVSVSEKAAALDPDRSGIYHNVGVLELARGNSEQAEASFKKALELDPKSARACLALAELYRSTNRFPQAESWLKRAVALDPAGRRANETLASFYIDIGRAGDAEPYLKTLTDQAKTIGARLSLADYYIAIGRTVEARTILQQLQSASDTYSVATTRMAMIEFASGHADRAHQLVDEVLKKQPANAAALVVKSRLLLADGDVEAAMAAAKNAVAADQRSAAPQIVLGRALMARMDVDKARSAFREALTLDPRAVEAQIELARLHLLQGQAVTAIDYAQRGLDTQPNNLAAGLTLARSLIARRDGSTRADETIKLLAARFPRAPQVYDAAASLALMRKDMAGARRAWERALQLDPRDSDALSGLAGLSLAAKKPAEARALVDARLVKSPDDPDVLLLSAKLHIIDGQDDRAEAELKRAIEKDATNLRNYAILGEMYVRAHRLADAKRQFAALAAREPHSLAAHTMMGLLCEEQGDVDDAIVWYERAVRIDSRAAGAANNLAAIYAERNTNLDLALQLAEAAVAELPKAPEVNDTLGWIYYKKQLNSFALRALTRSVELDPSNPVHQYHLGLAYVQAGDDANARRTLELSLKLKSDFPGSDDARKALATLVY